MCLALVLPRRFRPLPRPPVLRGARATFFLIKRRPPRSPLFPYTPLFRSKQKTAYESTRLNSSHTLISYAVFCLDRKSTRLNSSHTLISYAVFCFKKN